MCTVGVIHRPEHVQESSCVLFNVIFQSSLKDIDCYRSSSIDCECVPDLWCDSSICFFVN